MNEKLIFEALYWLVDKTKVGIDESDTKIIMQDNLALEIVKLTPKKEASFTSKTEDALGDKNE